MEMRGEMRLGSHCIGFGTIVEFAKRCFAPGLCVGQWQGIGNRDETVLPVCCDRVHLCGYPSRLCMSISLAADGDRSRGGLSPAPFLLASSRTQLLLRTHP